MSPLAVRLNAIHAKLRDGSRTASRDLFAVTLKPMVGYLRRSVPGLGEDEAHDCAVDAMVAFLENQERFDPGRSSLWTFLCLVAERDAIDKVRQQGNRQRLLEKDGYNVELWGARSNNEHEDANNRMDAETIMREHGAAIATDEAERRVLGLILEGERSVAAYALALRLEPDAEDTVEQVKRAKDRINQRLKKVRDEL